MNRARENALAYSLTMDVARNSRSYHAETGQRRARAYWPKHDPLEQLDELEYLVNDDFSKVTLRDILVASNFDDRIATDALLQLVGDQLDERGGGPDDPGEEEKREVAVNNDHATTTTDHHSIQNQPLPVSLQSSLISLESTFGVNPQHHTLLTTAQTKFSPRTTRVGSQDSSDEEEEILFTGTRKTPSNPPSRVASEVGSSSPPLIRTILDLSTRERELQDNASLDETLARMAALEHGLSQFKTQSPSASSEEATSPSNDPLESLLPPTVVSFGVALATASAVPESLKKISYSPTPTKRLFETSETGVSPKKTSSAAAAVTAAPKQFTPLPLHQTLSEDVEYARFLEEIEEEKRRDAFKREDEDARFAKEMQDIESQIAGPLVASAPPAQEVFEHMGNEVKGSYREDTEMSILSADEEYARALQEELNKQFSSDSEVGVAVPQSHLEEDEQLARMLQEENYGVVSSIPTTAEVEDSRLAESLQRAEHAEQARALMCDEELARELSQSQGQQQQQSMRGDEELARNLNQDQQQQLMRDEELARELSQGQGQQQQQLKQDEEFARELSQGNQQQGMNGFGDGDAALARFWATDEVHSGAMSRMSAAPPSNGAFSSDEIFSNLSSREEESARFAKFMQEEENERFARELAGEMVNDTPSLRSEDDGSVSHLKALFPTASRGDCVSALRDSNFDLETAAATLEHVLAEYPSLGLGAKLLSTGSKTSAIGPPPFPTPLAKSSAQAVSSPASLQVLFTTFTKRYPTVPESAIRTTVETSQGDAETAAMILFNLYPMECIACEMHNKSSISNRLTDAGNVAAVDRGRKIQVKTLRGVSLVAPDTNDLSESAQMELSHQRADSDDEDLLEYLERVNRPYTFQDLIDACKRFGDFQSASTQQQPIARSRMAAHDQTLYVALRGRVDTYSERIRDAFRKKGQANKLQMFDEANRWQAVADAYKMKSLATEAEAADCLFVQKNAELVKRVWKSELGLEYEETDPDAVLNVDFHALHVHETQERLFAVLVLCYARGWRNLRVIVGKGIHSIDQSSRLTPTVDGVLRANRALVQSFDIRNGFFVVKICKAGKRGSGEGGGVGNSTGGLHQQQPRSQYQYHG